MLSRMMTVMTGVHCAVEVCSRGVLTVKVGTARVLPVNAMAFTSVLVALAITRQTSVLTCNYKTNVRLDGATARDPGLLEQILQTS